MQGETAERAPPRSMQRASATGPVPLPIVQGQQLMLARCLVHVQTLAKYMLASRARSDYRNSLQTGKKESARCEHSEGGEGGSEEGGGGEEAQPLKSSAKDASSSASLSSFSGNMMRDEML